MNEQKTPKHPEPDDTNGPLTEETPVTAPEAVSQGAQGRYGLEEEPIDSPAIELPSTPRDPDQINRDADRDEEVQKTGEDLV